VTHLCRLGRRLHFTSPRRQTFGAPLHLHRRCLHDVPIKLSLAGSLGGLAGAYRSPAVANHDQNTPRLPPRGETAWRALRHDRIGSSQKATYLSANILLLLLRDGVAVRVKITFMACSFVCTAGQPVTRRNFPTFLGESHAIVRAVTL
jgi:hypothetical protein